MNKIPFWQRDDVNAALFVILAAGFLLAVVWPK